MRVRQPAQTALRDKGRPAGYRLAMHADAAGHHRVSLQGRMPRKPSEKHLVSNQRGSRLRGVMNQSRLSGKREACSLETSAEPVEASLK
jgi:hypothetical protein